MPEPANLSGHAARNRDVWNTDAPNWVASGRESWASPTPWWGAWHIPEEELQILPEVAGLDVLDLGCGTGYWCAWFARLGARPVGLDLSEEQLATAQALQAEHGIEFPLIHASAEAPPLEDGSFDLVFSEYGASIWCDPALWIAEASRLLRPGGELVFMRGSTVQMLCMPDEGQVAERLVRPQKGIYRLEWWDDDPGVEFHPSTSEMFAVLRSNGFELLDFRELFAPEDAVDHEYYSTVPADWAKRWPDEEIWRLRLQRR